MPQLQVVPGQRLPGAEGAGHGPRHLWGLQAGTKVHGHPRTQNRRHRWTLCLSRHRRKSGEEEEEEGYGNYGRRKKRMEVVLIGRARLINRRER